MLKYIILVVVSCSNLQQLNSIDKPINKRKLEINNHFIEAIKKGDIQLFKKILAGYSISKNNEGNIALFTALETQNEEIILLLIEKGININQKNQDELTPLMIVSKNGNLKLVDLLINKNASINYENKFKYTALTYAAENEHEEVVDILIAKGANLKKKLTREYIKLIKSKKEKRVDLALENITHNQKDEILIKAINDGDCEKVILLLKNDSKIDKNYLLIKSINNWNVDLTRILLENGADVNYEYDHMNRTPLMLAASQGSIEIISLLLEKGADIKKISKFKESVFLSAFESNKIKTLNFLLNKSFNINESNNNVKTPLMEAAYKSKKLVKWALEKGAKINGEDYIGDTALKAATSSGNLEIVSYLISKGANVNKKNKFSYTALTEASEKGHIEIVELLISKGANIDDTRSALIQASREGHIEIVELLISKGANINFEEEDYTPLMAATLKDKKKIVSILIKAEAAIDKKNSNGETALMLALSESRVEIAKKLINAGANIREKDKYGSAAFTKASSYEGLELILNNGIYVDEEDRNGRTFLTFASKFQCDKEIKLLLDRGADIDKADLTWGETPLMLAISNKESYDFKTVKLLLERGADINKNIRGVNALKKGIINGNLNLLKFLIDKGADINKNSYFSFKNCEIAKVMIQNSKYDFLNSATIFKLYIKSSLSLPKDILFILISSMQMHYEKNKEYTSYNLYLALNRLHSSKIFHYDKNLKIEYEQLLRKISSFMLRCCKELNLDKNYINLIEYINQVDDGIFSEIAFNF